MAQPKEFPEVSICRDINEMLHSLSPIFMFKYKKDVPYQCTDCKLGAV